MLFLVTCLYDEGMYKENFRVVEAESRLAVAQHIVDNSGLWSDWLQRSRLYDPIVRGNMPYYVDAEPVGAEEALEIIDGSHLDGDSRAQFAIHPIPEILDLKQWKVRYSRDD